MILGRTTPPVKLPGQHKRISTLSERSEARCIDSRHYIDGGCVEMYCPRHDPLAYAEYMARHATDSIR